MAVVSFRECMPCLDHLSHHALDERLESKVDKLGMDILPLRIEALD